MYLFVYPLQQLKLSLRYLGHISWRILLYTRIPLNLPNEVLESDSSLLTQFLKCQTLRSVQVVYRIGYLLLFFADFDTFCFFIQSLGFTLRESWQKFEQRSRWGGPTPIAKRFFYLVRLLEIDADPFSCSWSVRPWSGYWNRSLAHFSWLISVAFSKHLPPRHLYCFILQWHWCLSLLIILSKKCFGSWC